VIFIAPLEVWLAGNDSLEAGAICQLFRTLQDII